MTPRSGFVVTAGGLVVFADNQSKLYPLDKNTGKVVHSRDVPKSAVGVPAVYEVNGREYILFSLTGGRGFPAGARMPPGGEAPLQGRGVLWLLHCRSEAENSWNSKEAAPPLLTAALLTIDMVMGR